MQKVPSFEPLESRLVLSASLAPVAVGALAGNVAATTEPVTTRPPTPTGLHVTLVAPRGARLEWADVAGETGYAIERRIDGTTDAWARVGTTAADVTHFAQDGLTAGKTYLYRVRALNGDVASEPSAAASVKIPGEATTPAAPHLEVSLVAPRAAKLTWTNVAGRPVDLSALVTNFTDEKYYTYENNYTGSFGFAVRFPAPPRRFEISAAYHF